MKIKFERQEADKAEILGDIGKVAAKVAAVEIRKFFKTISHEEFVTIMRRALRTSCDAFFQHYMQYYIEQRSPDIFKMINQDIISMKKKQKAAKK